MQIVRRVKLEDGTITFFLAFGASRQMCRLATTFSTQKQAFTYLQRHRTEFEHMARARLASGELEDGIVVLSML
ncbi:hypothetical protein G8O24_40260 [Bradyrhizobium sp. INPA01-394B]|uniref:DUF1488 domain-containing protein n=1 Tax=Bradyrhizobium campsiandrae TaxID=1729892 RepID=A0ABR7UJ13_9BRAD|nr:hypothetical protein [Bradyrhizobium campsiandrae]MBC9883523.1 hypothetical protein [Bradyrhizobium campsiandrae]MBC9983883.1 hypothetical protein [Bradyrhizobium campsiandrae]